ncbi:tetratricopeptide repeat-containing sensor histidine kinase [Aquimarina algicola]|uniref:histidine kinase n=1 Tax=Aquimarina algicola TaxID=2589995 RepID=A0A504JEZ8_9FLAO|nr:tetratricopeptide repeat protein [Aquimarina algicola]TPN86203.1 tetratricopeptide repeat protein [Aquimarina algicola]
MKSIDVKKIVTSFIFLFSILLSAQKTSDEALNTALDSMMSNPNYSYALFSKISKNKQKSYIVRAEAELGLARYFNSIGIADSSMYYARKSLIHLRSKKHLATAYRVLGSSYRRKGKMKNARQLLFRSLEISEEIKFKEMISKVKSDLGILYINEKDFEKGLQFLKESIAIAENGQAVYGNYVNIGNIYFYKGDFDNAEKYYTKAFELMPKQKDPKVSATIALNLGSVLFENSKYKKASDYYQKSKQIADMHGLKDKSLNASIHQAMVLDAIGNEEDAIGILEAARIPAEKNHNLEIQKTINENLANIYSKIGNHQSANISLKRLYTLKDSIRYKQKQKEIVELEVKYETARKQKEIDLLKIKTANKDLELKNQQKAYSQIALEQALENEKKTNEILVLKNTKQQRENEILTLKEEQLLKNEEIKRERLLKRSFIIGFLIILLPIMALLFVYYQKLQIKNEVNMQREEINKQKIDAFLKEQELKLANTYVFAQNEERSRIARELHDYIGGNLASLKLQIENTHENDSLQESVLEQLDDIYEQVREISHNLIPKKICDTLYTNYIDNYIESLKKAKKPEIVFIPHPKNKVNRMADHLKVEIFKIIQELLTNALKYAKAGIIEICLNVYDRDIEIIFEDNGIGFDKEQSANGIGLSNIQQRLNQLQAKMDIDSMINRGTAIRIKIPN